MEDELCLFPDTTPEAQAVLIETIRQMTPSRRLEMMAQLNDQMRLVALAGIRQRHPHAGASELKRRLADLWLGPQLAATVYGSLAAAIAIDHDHADTTRQTSR